VGTLERLEGRAALRTASEEWRMDVRRRARRLGWHLDFIRADGGEPVLQYHPRGLRPGGDLVLPGGRRYRLRCDLLGAKWRLAAVPGGAVGRIGFRDEGSGPYLRAQLASADEPLLVLVILAASVAILIHGEQPSASGGS
jgi:hypothetical protein